VADSHTRGSFTSSHVVRQLQLPWPTAAYIASKYSKTRLAAKLRLCDSNVAGLHKRGQLHITHTLAAWKWLRHRLGEGTFRLRQPKNLSVARWCAVA